MSISPIYFVRYEDIYKAKGDVNFLQDTKIPSYQPFRNNKQMNVPELVYWILIN